MEASESRKVNLRSEDRLNYWIPQFLVKRILKKQLVLLTFLVDRYSLALQLTHTTMFGRCAPHPRFYKSLFRPTEFEEHATSQKQGVKKKYSNQKENTRKKKILSTSFSIPQILRGHFFRTLVGTSVFFVLQIAGRKNANVKRDQCSG